MTYKYFVSHVLFLSTANGSQPRTPVVIIYLQVKLVLCLVRFPTKRCPYLCLGCSLMGFTRSTSECFHSYSSLWHFQGFISYLVKDLEINSVHYPKMSPE